MTEEIRCEIKNRRELNRRQRNCNAENREQNWGRYLQQKELVKQMIRKELGKYQKRATQEIREAKDSGQKMWNIVNKLKGSEKTETEIPLYSEEGECIEESQPPGFSWGNDEILGKHLQREGEQDEERVGWVEER